MDLDTVAELGQKYVAARPVIVLGAGASIPLGLPSMGSLGAHLISSIAAPAVDPARTAWLNFVQALKAGVGLEQSLHDVELDAPTLSKVVTATWELTNRGCLDVHSAIMTGKASLALVRLFEHLLRTANPRIQVVTTNYDRLAEYAAALSGSRAHDGFSTGYVGRFVLDPTRLQPQRGISVWKVHGSLDWFLGVDGLPIASPLAREVPDGLVPLVVTPGLSKYRETHREPYRTVMASADHALSTASSVLCVGYGFNDEHVQARLAHRVRVDDIPVVVVTHTLSDAARSIVLSGKCRKYLAIEARAGGSVVYAPQAPGGAYFDGQDFWSLGGFLDLVLGKV